MREGGKQKKRIRKNRMRKIKMKTKGEKIIWFIQNVSHRVVRGKPWASAHAAVWKEISGAGVKLKESGDRSKLSMG